MISITKGFLNIKNKLHDVRNIDILKLVPDGILIINADNSLCFYREDVNKASMTKSLSSPNFPEFVSIQNMFVNRDNLIGISAEPGDTKIKFIFERHEEEINLNSEEELVSIGLKLQKTSDHTI